VLCALWGEGGYLSIGRYQKLRHTHTGYFVMTFRRVE
jgi:hypothetical protein